MAHQPLPGPWQMCGNGAVIVQYQIDTLVNKKAL
jgi:hypothetical protein